MDSCGTWHWPRCYRRFYASGRVDTFAMRVGVSEANIHGTSRPCYVLMRGFQRKRGGFGRPLAAFIYSIAITNVVGAFIEEVSRCIFGLVVVVFSVVCRW